MSSDSDNIRPLSSWSDCLRESEEQLQAFYCDYGKFVMTLGPGYLSRPNMHQRATTVAMHQMLSTGKYSDLTVCCGLEVFKVHRAIVCPRSKFFAAACDGGFQEATTSRINLSDDDTATVKRMLLYLYLQDYDDTEPQSSSSWPPSPETGDEDAEILLLLGDDGEMKEEDLEDKEVKTKRLANESHPKLLANISVYATADKYDIPALKDLAEDKFKALALGVWPHKDFSTVIHEVFESTPSSDDGLRAIVTKVCIKHITDMLNEDQYTTILQTTPPLTFALMQHIKTTSAETQAQQLSQNDTQITNLLQQQNDRLDIWAQNARALIISAKAVRNCVGCGRSELEFVRVQHERELRGVLRCVWCEEEYVLDAGSGRGTVIEEVD